MPFKGECARLESRVAFVYHFYLVFFNLKKNLSLFDFYDLDTFDDYRPVIFRKSFSLICLMFPHNYFQVMHIWQENHRSENFFFIESY